MKMCDLISERKPLQELSNKSKETQYKEAYIRAVTKYKKLELQVYEYQDKHALAMEEIKKMKSEV